MVVEFAIAHLDTKGNSHKHQAITRQGSRFYPTDFKFSHLANDIKVLYSFISLVNAQSMVLAPILVKNFFKKVPLAYVLLQIFIPFD